jgi:hypothetical protein
MDAAPVQAVVHLNHGFRVRLRRGHARFLRLPRLWSP